MTGVRDALASWQSLILLGATLLLVPTAYYAWINIVIDIDCNRLTVPSGNLTI